MFPFKVDSDGRKVQGPLNAQGAAFVAGKWIRSAIELGYAARAYDRRGYSGIHLTYKGEALAKAEADSEIAKRWRLDRKNEDAARAVWMKV